MLNEHLKKVHLPAGEVTGDQLAKIHSLRNREDSSVRWRRIYGILFPADDRVPPPFSPSPEQLQIASQNPHAQVIANWKRRINIHGFHILEEETKDNLLRLCSGMISPFIDAVNEVGLLNMDMLDTMSSPPLAGTSDWIQHWAGLVHESGVTVPPFTSIELSELGASALTSSDNLPFSDEGDWPMNEGDTPL